jgi:hypothetical protein
MDVHAKLVQDVVQGNASSYEFARLDGNCKVDARKHPYSPLGSDDPNK